LLGGRSSGQQRHQVVTAFPSRLPDQCDRSALITVHLVADDRLMPAFGAELQQLGSPHNITPSIYSSQLSHIRMRPKAPLDNLPATGCPSSTVMRCGLWRGTKAKGVGGDESGSDQAGQNPLNFKRDQPQESRAFSQPKHPRDTTNSARHDQLVHPCVAPPGFRPLSLLNLSFSTRFGIESHAFDLVRFSRKFQSQPWSDARGGAGSGTGNF